MIENILDDYNYELYYYYYYYLVTTFFLVIVSSKHFLVETEDDPAEYSGNIDNPDEYQKAADYCFKGFKPCWWGARGK